MTCLPCHWPWHGRLSFPHILTIPNFFHLHFRLNNMSKGNNNDNSSVKTNLAIVHGSMDFFRYLQEHSRDRFSRFEAYLYMLDKACTNYRPQNIDAKWIPALAMDSSSSRRQSSLLTGTGIGPQSATSSQSSLSSVASSSKSISKGFFVR